jgi:hypothetical protein
MSARIAPRCNHGYGALTCLPCDIVVAKAILLRRGDGEQGGWKSEISKNQNHGFCFENRESTLIFPRIARMIADSERTFTTNRR